MKESKFIEQNKKNWLEFETNLRLKQNKATRLSSLFIQITDDLSYARTFYKHRSVKVYLNGIAQALFNDLYQNQKGGAKRFINFWKTDLPRQIFEARKEFLISFLIFTVSFCIGILSSIYDKDFAAYILGDDYVNMTLENIKKSDPLAVYKSGSETSMFLGITINNLIVALLTFILGIIISIGTIFRLIYNGVMVGTFQYFFIEKGLFKESFLTIWQHGTLEISCIIIAGAAGIIFGKGLLFPGTFTRSESFKISALKGLKIFTGIVPLLIIAAFIEGFLTRYTDLPDIIRLLVILLSLAFVLFYFVWYPRKVYRQITEPGIKNERVSYKEPSKFSFSGILSTEEILGYTLRYINLNKLKVILLILGIPVLHALYSLIMEAFINNDERYIALHNFLSFFQIKNISFQYFIGIGTLSFIQCISFISVKKTIDASQQRKHKIEFIQTFKLVTGSILVSLGLLSSLYGGIFWGSVSLIFAAPFLFLSLYQGFEENKFILKVIPETFQLIKFSWAKLYWNSIKFYVFVIIFYIFLSTPFVWQYLESIISGFSSGIESSYYIEMFVFVTIVIILFVLFFVLLASSSVFSYFSFRETVYGESLKKRIDRFGERNSIFGFEKERTS